MTNDTEQSGAPKLSTGPAATISGEYRWTPACQRAFLEELASTGSVVHACAHVGKSPRSAYALRFRRDGAALALGWDAAILNARVVVADMLMERAICGYEEVTVKQDDGTRVRQKMDNRLGLNLLARLDRMAEAQALRNSVQAHVQLIAQDFEAYLDLIERGGTGAQAALFCSARGGDGDHVTVDEEYLIDCELDRMSLEDDFVPTPVVELLDEEPEVAAQRLSVWFDDDAMEWKTNFPAADVLGGLYDCDEPSETGHFGDAHYERALTPAERAAHLTRLYETMKPWIVAAEAERDAWFGTGEGRVEDQA